MIDNIKISKMPYLGFSKNLMEFFIVIGYDETVLKQSEPLLNNQKSLPITILANVISDLAYEQFEPYSILKRVYPDIPKILKTNKKPPNSDVIFSSCIDSVKGNKKIATSGYALRFYEEYIDEKKDIYYVPKAFLIYSQYPYFNTYYQICQKLLEYKTLDRKNKIPIEILIYCLINYIPSPLNSNIIFKDLGLNITIPKLTGYPYADFDIKNVINAVQLKDFIKIYILIYLEIPLLFFSSDLKILNLFMFVLYLLNYPLTDSSYFWHIETISEKGLKSVEQAILQGFKGINTQYKENTDLGILNEVEFIIDLEGENKIVSRKKSKESKKILDLLNYIDKILNNKKPSKSYFLYKDLLKLFTSLKAIIENNNQIKEGAQLDKYFNMNEEIDKRNKEIQLLFYDFIIDNLIILNKDFEIDPTKEYPIKKKLFTDSNLSNEEKFFLKNARDSIKYNTYFDLFIKRFTVSDELKISLLFVDEFVNLKKEWEKWKKKEKFETKEKLEILENLKNIMERMPYFDIIDNLYKSNQSEEKNENKIINLISNNKKDINTKFDEGKMLLIKKENDDDDSPQLFALDEKKIKIFMYQKKNKDYYETLKKPEELKLESIDRTSIITVIQDYFIEKNKEDKSLSIWIWSSFIYIFSIVFPILSYSRLDKFLDAVLKRIEKNVFFQRYYILILLRSINKYYIVNKKKEQFPDFSFNNISKFYYKLGDYLNSNSIIQNEETFMIFKSFSSEKEKREKGEIDEIEEEEMDDEPLFVYKQQEKDEYLEIDPDEFVNKGPTVIKWRRNNKIIISKKKSKDDIYKQSKDLYDDYFTKSNFNIALLNIQEIMNLSLNILCHFKGIDETEIKTQLYNLIPILDILRNEVDIFTTKKTKEEAKKEEEKKVKEEKEEKKENN